VRLFKKSGAFSSTDISRELEALDCKCEAFIKKRLFEDIFREMEA
jgi:hypothetical protein